MNSSDQPVAVISKVAKGVIAFKAEQPSDDTGIVIVINVQGNLAGFPTANGAAAVLIDQHLLVLFDRDSELSHEVGRPLPTLHLR